MAGLALLSQKQQFPAFLMGAVCVSLGVSLPGSGAACAVVRHRGVPAAGMPGWGSLGVILPQDFLTASICAVQLLNIS